MVEDLWFDRLNRVVVRNSSRREVVRAACALLAGATPRPATGRRGRRGPGTVLTVPVPTTLHHQEGPQLLRDQVRALPDPGEVLRHRRRSERSRKTGDLLPRGRAVLPGPQLLLPGGYRLLLRPQCSPCCPVGNECCSSDASGCCGQNETCCPGVSAAETRRPTTTTVASAATVARLAVLALMAPAAVRTGMSPAGAIAAPRAQPASTAVAPARAMVTVGDGARPGQRPPLTAAAAIPSAQSVGRRAAAFAAPAISRTASTVIARRAPSGRNSACASTHSASSAPISTPTAVAQRRAARFLRRSRPSLGSPHRRRRTPPAWRATAAPRAPGCPDRVAPTEPPSEGRNEVPRPA